MNYKYLFWLITGIIIGYIFQINNLEGFENLTGCNDSRTLNFESSGEHNDEGPAQTDPECDKKFKIKIHDFIMNESQEENRLMYSKSNYINKIYNSTFYERDLKKIIYISLDEAKPGGSILNKMKLEFTYGVVNRYKVYLFDYNTFLMRTEQTPVAAYKITGSIGSTLNNTNDIYEVTEHKCNGKPVYQDSDGHVLFQSSPDRQTARGGRSDRAYRYRTGTGTGGRDNWMVGREFNDCRPPTDMTIQSGHNGGSCPDSPDGEGCERNWMEFGAPPAGNPDCPDGGETCWYSNPDISVIQFTPRYQIAGSTLSDGIYEFTENECNDKPVYQGSDGNVLFNVLDPGEDKLFWGVRTTTDSPASVNCTGDDIILTSNGEGSVCPSRPDGRGCKNRWEEFNDNTYLPVPHITVTAPPTPSCTSFEGGVVNPEGCISTIDADNSPYLEIISNTFTEDFESVFTLYDKENPDIYITLEIIPDNTIRLTKDKIKSALHNSFIEYS